MLRLIIFSSFLQIIIALSVGSAAEIATTSEDQQLVSVTIYNTDIALVRDQRIIDLPQGVITLAYGEVSSKILPETALLGSSGLEVLEQNFEYDLLTPMSLLQKYIGRRVNIIKEHPVTGAEAIVQAKVLSVGDGVVLQTADHIETDIPGRLVYPDVPDNLRDRPTLTMLVSNDIKGKQEVDLTYLTRGLSWQADYVAEIDAKDDQIDLNGWVSLTNESGIDYRKAGLQLVAGDVHRVTGEPRARGLKKNAMVAEAAPGRPDMAEEALFEYHLYTLGRPTTINNHQRKQVALFQASDVPCQKELVLQGRNYYYNSNIGEIGRKMKLGVYVEFKNAKEAGIGRPIPGGIVRVYKKDRNGFLQFIGEDRIDHTAENEDIRLKLGNAFDVTADKVQTDFTKLSGFSPFHYVFESAYEIVLRNGKKESVRVQVQEPIPGDWEMISESAPHTKEAANTVSWTIDIPALGQVLLTYRVRVKY